MKLSYKFFCIAYIIVLISTGLGGIIIIRNINDTLRNSRIDQVNSAVNYAAESFLSLADISSGEISGENKYEIIRQIERTLDSSVRNVEIYTPETVSQEYTELEVNRCLSQFIKKDDRIIMEAVCRVSHNFTDYYIVLQSDFTEIQEQCRAFRNSYGLIIFIISSVSGLILFAAAKKITKPLSQLAKATDEIALGNYGEKVNIKSSDYEITALTESFNTMSSAVAQKITEIREESEKRSMFVADFTHELKTPMTAIIGYSQMMFSYELNSRERKEASKAIYSEAKRLEKLSLQLLNLYVYRNENIETEEVALSYIEERLRAVLIFLAKKYNVAFDIQFGRETVIANSVLLLSLLCNLADNAFKASEPLTIIRIYSESFNDHVRIYVADQGRGIAKENMEFLTEPFYREDKSRSRKLGGAGLGLSLCKEIAVLHGTELKFESVQGLGTTVSFELKKGGDYYE